jgi:primosomal protein N'
MPEGTYLYCDVSLPVPMDQPFTYSLPETLRHRVKPGCRLAVPFGPRKLTGLILRCHDEKPAMATREALRLIDSDAVLSGELIALGRWIAGYYCAPLGGNPAREDLVADGFRPRRRAPTAARFGTRRSGGRSAAPARTAAALRRLAGQDPAAGR